MRYNTLEKFINLIIINSGCWGWLGSVDKDGYPIFSFSKYNNRTKRAQRLIYEICHGKFDSNLCVYHRCDNPICLNPEHLFLGTLDDNNKDCSKKGRTKNQNSNVTHCRNGHEFTNENTYIRKRKTGGRICKICCLNRSKNKYRILKCIQKEGLNGK